MSNNLSGYALGEPNFLKVRPAPGQIIMFQVCREGHNSGKKIGSKFLDYTIAIGLIGEPAPPLILRGSAINRNV